MKKAIISCVVGAYFVLALIMYQIIQDDIRMFSQMSITQTTIRESLKYIIKPYCLQVEPGHKRSGKWTKK